MANGKITLNQLKVRLAIELSSILDIRIESCANEHVKMYLEMEVPEEVTNDRLMSINNTPVEVSLLDGTVLFAGMCKDMSYTQQAGYRTVIIEAASFTIVADYTPETKTYQNPSKKLNDVVEDAFEKWPYMYSLKENVSISQVLYQFNETDWAFLRRIVNELGMNIYADSRVQQADMYIGSVGMRTHSADDLRQQLSIGKDIDEQRQFMANIDNLAASYQFESSEYLCDNLLAIAGDFIGVYIIEEAVLYNNGGLLENKIRVVRVKEAKPTVSATRATTFISNIITGEVIHTEGNIVKVKFNQNGDNSPSGCVEIPYESVISNSFYCMPDVGDTVYVYYENNGKIVCLGSKRKDTSHSDFDTPEEKVLTNKDHMIRFSGKQLAVTGTRALHDAGDDKAISIILDDESGIIITSGKDVEITSNKGSDINLASYETEGYPKLASRAVLSGMLKHSGAFNAGSIKYGQDKNMNGWDKFFASQKKEGERTWEDVKTSFKGLADDLTLKTLRDAIFAKDGSASEEETEEPIERFDTGTITLYGLNEVMFKVGDSAIVLDSDIYIQSDIFSWLGYIKNEHEIISEEPTDWWDVGLDALQLVLDIGGMIPGIGIFCDLANAAISLTRGDYAGAAMSLLGAIPVVGDIAMAGKLGAKALKAATTVTKAIDKVSDFAKQFKNIGKIFKITKNIYSGLELVNLGLQIDDSMAEMLKDGFNFNDPKDWKLLIEIISNTKEFGENTVDFAGDVAGTKKGNSDADGNNNSDNSDNNNTTDNRDNNDNTDNNDNSNENDAESETSRTNDGDSVPKENTETTVDPINVVTGSLQAEYVDLSLEDVLGSYDLKRHYESIYDNRGGVLGGKWRFELESSVIIKGRLASVQMPDLHIEKFVNEDGIWHNERREDCSLTFCTTADGYRLTEENSATSYDYDTTGKLSAITDIHGNRTTFEYGKDHISRLTTASGQWMEFTYDKGLLSEINDCLGRKVSYTYKDGYLISAMLPNGGLMRYEYTREGYLTQITDLNGIWYSKNYFDRKGRVIRQELAGGEEYVAFYDDANKQNTFLTTSNGENIVYTYGIDNLIRQIRYPDQTTVEREYDKAKNLIMEKDRLGRKTYRSYNSQGMITKEEYADGYIKEYEYNDMNLPVHVWDNTGREIINTYDESGNMTENRTKIDEHSDRVTRFTYDRQGRILTVTDSRGNTEEYRYNSPFSQPTMTKLKEGGVVEYTFDEGGRMTEVTDAFGTASHGYNSLGHRIRSTDAEGNTTRFFYDGMANLRKVIQPNSYNPVTDEGPGTEYTYDVWTNITRRITPEGGIWLYESDYRGNLISEKNPLQSMKEGEEGTRYEYDINRNRIRTIYPDGSVLREFYDVCGNLTKRILPEQYDEKTDDGAGYTYEYDSRNRITRIINPEGMTEHAYVYDIAGNLIKDISAKGYELSDSDITRPGTIYTHDLLGNVTSVRTPVDFGEENEDGGIAEKTAQNIRYSLTTYTYDTEGNCTEEKRYLDYQDETGSHGRVNVITYAYDKENHLISVNDSTGACMEYTYDQRGQRTFEKKKISEDTWHERLYEYSPAGRIVRVAESSDENGCGRKYVSTRFTYDANGNLTKIQTPSGNEIIREYDVCDRLVAETHKEKQGSIDNRTTYSYDKLDNLTVVEQGDSYTIRHSYDKMNRLCMTVDGSGGVTRYSYDTNGNLTGKISPQENADLGEQAAGYRYIYDIYGRNTQIFSPDGNLMRKVTYNRYGEAEWEGDALGGVKAVHDFMGRRTCLETMGGRTQKYTYDARGNITGLTDGNGNTTAFETDTWGRVTEVSLADGSRESYAYDHAGNMTHATDGNGNTVTYEYNRMGKMSVRTDAAGNRETFAYDNEGRLCEHTDRDGRRNIFRYNMYQSPTLREETESGTTESWEYDGLGRLKSAIGGGMRYEYSYLPGGQLKEKKASGRTLLSYAYDLDGNITKRIDITGKTTTYRHDRQGRMSHVLEGERILAAYGYHEDRSLASLKVGNDLTTTYTYDTDRNISGIRTLDRNHTFASYSYEYDGNANRITKESLEGLTRYSYDANNRLVEVRYPDPVGSFEKLFYDKAGNRIRRETGAVMESYVYDRCNRLMELTRERKTGLEGQSHTVPTGDGKADMMNGMASSVLSASDINNQVIRYTYDKQGNLLSDDKHTYTYDGFSRLSEVMKDNQVIQRNHYDAEGLRHEMEENGELVKFLFNENREVVTEENAEGKRIRYIRGLGIVSSDSEEARNYYHYVSDEQGSITHILKGDSKGSDNGMEENAVSENAESRVLNRYTYDAFGNTEECEESVHNRFRYNGEQYDPATGQYYLRARFYNPVIARFTQEDTYYGDGLNLYAYCANNPVGYGDPSGHNICPTQRNVYHEACQEYMRQNGLTEYSQIPQNEKLRMYREMRTELGLNSDSRYRESGTGPDRRGDRSLETSGNGSMNRSGTINQVEYGSTDLSQEAIRFRQENNITGARNIAVYEYENNGQLSTIAGASQRNQGHAERLIAKELENMGIQPAQVRRIYSELEPCSIPGGYCKRFLQTVFPQADVTYSFEYGLTQESRRAGVNALKEAVKNLFKKEAL